MSPKGESRQGFDVYMRTNVLTDILKDYPPAAQMLIGLLLLLCAAYTCRVLAGLLLHWLGRVRDRRGHETATILLNKRILERLIEAVPSLVIQLGIVLVPALGDEPVTIIRNLAMAVTVLHLTRTLSMVLEVLLEGSRLKQVASRTRSVKSYVQLARMVLFIGASIIIIGILLDRSPVIVLSGFGAMSAVLMLIFKDTILSFTAGVLISQNDMLRIGDWIEMPQVGADGDVIDIALHTVKVQNWDKTITTIPTWRLMAESYKNWRGMQESGGRRIKRSIRIDAGTVRFLSDDEILKFKEIAVIRLYIEKKLSAVEQTNRQQREILGPMAQIPTNQRRLTNIGTFRAYALAYLQTHPGIHHDMTMMVRQMEPTHLGIPIELYCFTSTILWVDYENIQGDIFDHLLAVLPELGLRVYQQPSGADVRQALVQADPERQQWRSIS